ncbi:MAG TPA: hypothetical protein VNW92_18185, partial [Polyangiaceae bacterium]|nr:hypothetical protein [Polyangiaceae bacterium]
MRRRVALAIIALAFVGIETSCRSVPASRPPHPFVAPLHEQEPAAHAPSELVVKTSDEFRAFTSLSFVEPVRVDEGLWLAGLDYQVEAEASVPIWLVRWDARERKFLDRLS